MKDLKLTRPTQVESDAAYLAGKAKNVTVSGDNTGTPWIDDVINDQILGVNSAILAEAGFVPDGTDEKAGQSQIVDAIKLFTGISEDGKITTHKNEVDAHITSNIKDGDVTLADTLTNIKTDISAFSKYSTVEYEDLPQSVPIGAKTLYNGKDYLARFPIDDVTIAPPTTAGRTFTNFDGSTQYITIPTINLIAGDVVELKFLAPTSIPSAWVTLIDGDAAASPLDVYLTSTGKIFYASGVTLKIDGNLCTSNVTEYPKDGLLHDIEITLSGSKTLKAIAAKGDSTLKYKGRIYDLEVYRGGERIHYYPLRVDAIDYLAGNLVKDEEFTWEGNWKFSNTSATLGSNALLFNASASGTTAEIPTTKTEPGTYRYIYDYSVTSGSIRGYTRGGDTWDSLKSGVGTVDSIVVINTVGTGDEGFISSSNTTATVKNFRVIKLNELSPSASFDSSAGFNLSGGVTITGGQAVFGSGGGTKSIFVPVVSVTGKKFRFVYKVNSGTVGSYRVQASSFSSGATPLKTSNGEVDEVITLSGASIGFYLITPDGWDGNVEYFSVTEVTDGAEVGSPVHEFDKYWSYTLNDQDVMVLKYPSYTIATLPLAATATLKQVYVSDTTPPAPAYSDGVNWLKYSDNSVIV